MGQPAQAGPLALTPVAATEALGTGFTYQGRLKSGLQAVTALCVFQFSLYDAATLGSQVGNTQTVTGVTVTTGLFTVLVNAGGEFGGSAFNGQARWLAVSVKCPSDAGYTALTPRQPLTAAPYALYADAAPWAGLSNVPAGFADNTDNDTLYTNGLGLDLAGGAFSVVSSTVQLRVTGDCAADSSIRSIAADGSVICETDDDTTYTNGLGLDLAGGQFSVVSSTVQLRVAGDCGPGYSIRAIDLAGAVTCEQDDTGGGDNYWGLFGNTGTTPSYFAGTTDNMTFTLGVSSTTGLRLGPTTSTPNLLGGSSANTVTNGAAGVVIAGGGTITQANQTSASYTVIGGGHSNTITSTYGIIGGGWGNRAGSTSTVAGGSQNASVGNGAAVGGGFQNIVTNNYATIAGGNGNLATGEGAFVGSGNHNEATGSYSTIGGGNVNQAPGSNATISGGTNNDASNSLTTVGGGSSNNASGMNATISGGTSNTASGGTTTISGGSANTASGSNATVGGGSSNSASDANATVNGGTNNQASDVNTTVGGGSSNSASDPNATVGGGSSNSASNSAATVAGGSQNQASGIDATVSGGLNNTANTINATVGGGEGNLAAGNHSTVSGGSDNDTTGGSSTIGGGAGNRITSSEATIAGGFHNTVSNSSATVGGGSNNTASGFAGVVPGGFSNTAAGSYSFAGGRLANAVTNGSFVWADSTGIAISSTVADQYLVRASGGVTLYTNSAATAGVSLDPGSGTWNMLSDRNLKANVVPVDGIAVLDALMQIPVATWNYTTQTDDIRHLGPMAQDFYSAFGLGASDTTISSIDADGVALAAIQGLYTVVQDQDAAIAEQQAQINALTTAQADMTARLAALEAGAQPTAAPALPWLLFGGLALLNVGGLIGYTLARSKASTAKH